MAIKKAPLLVATWKRNGSREWDGSTHSHLDTCSSTSLLLRTDIPRADWLNAYDSAVNDLKVRIWFDESSISIDIYVCEVYSKNEPELEFLLKTLKAIRRKAAKGFPLNQFVKDDPAITLVKFFSAIGLRKTVVYTEGYSRDEYERGSAIDLAGRIGQHINEVRKTFKVREAA